MLDVFTLSHSHNYEFDWASLGSQKLLYTLLGTVELPALIEGTAESTAWKRKKKNKKPQNPVPVH